MKRQGFGKDDLKPQETQYESDVVTVDEKKADEIIQAVLIDVASSVADQAGLDIPEQKESGVSDNEHLNNLLGELATVGVQLELGMIQFEKESGKPLMDVLVKQTVGQIDLSEAVTLKEDK